MDLQIVWSDEALDDLSNIAAYGVSDEWMADLSASVLMLGRLPHLGSRYDGDTRGRVREILCRPYRVFYRVDERLNRVSILRVWHSARREPRFPR